MQIETLQATDVKHFMDIGAQTKWGSYISDIEKQAILKANLSINEPGIALDIGCGGGRWSKLLSGFGWNIICTDIYQGGLDICKTRVPKAKCILVNPNDSDLPCETETIGLLLCIEVPTVVNSEWFIHEAYRALKTDGLAVIVFQNLFSIRGLFSYLTRSSNKGYYYKLPYSVWMKNLSQAGFKALYEEGFCWFPFKRISNSSFIPVLTRMERYLGLRRLVRVSPWIVLIAKKV
jgi:ubiquinone/menaquinone biosynthesis C-methylase UbiE